MTPIRSTSPQHPNDLVVEVGAADAGRVALAAQRARLAQREWASAGPGVRAAALSAAADAVLAASAELNDLLVREVGKPRSEANGEVARSISILRYYAQQAFDPVGAVFDPSSGSGLAFTRRRARGVAGLITPWNFPLAIPLWKAAPALAFGNAVLLKPAPQSTACALRLHELLEPHLPEGLFTVLPGDGETGKAILEEADVVSFTGSVRVGSAVVAVAARRGVPVQAEMGGQNPAIVLPRADMERAAEQIAGAAFGFAGQKCTATRRVIVVGNPAPFTEAFLAATRALRLGDPAEESVTVGPVIDDSARHRVVSAAAAGGRVVTGGTRADGEGWFIEPTMVTELPDVSPLLTEEIFGPICALLTVGSIDAAVEMANNVRYGLSAAVYTGDLNEALQVTDQLCSGIIKVNAPTTGVDFYQPFGGERDSSYGAREQGKSAHDFYTSLHTVSVANA